MVVRAALTEWLVRKWDSPSDKLHPTLNVILESRQLDDVKSA
jgi:hypothetical protein